MPQNAGLYTGAFICAFIITFLATPLAKKISVKTGAIDYPKDRGMHKEPMPRMGGIAIISGFMITVLLFSRYIGDIDSKEFFGLILGSAIIAALGAADDIKNLKAGFKLAVQLVAAAVVVFSGITIDVVFWPFTSVLSELSIPFTFIWIIGITNAVNLIDGLDGLAAGVSSIAALSLMVFCYFTGSVTAVMLTAALAGSCMGFLPQNFNPAKIFMGDSGSTFLGFILAVTSILGVFKGYAVLAALTAMLCLGLPVFDTLFAMLRRFMNHKPIMQADRGHLHHRLIDRGYSQKQAVCILYGISVICGLAAVLIAIRDLRVLAAMLATVAVLSYVIYRFNLNNKRH